MHGSNQLKVNDDSDGTVFIRCNTYSRYFFAAMSRAEETGGHAM